MKMPRRLVATDALNARIPMATCRCLGSGNMLKISDSVEGASVAPAIPSSVRLVISICGLVDRAANTETTPKAAAPSSSRRRPIPA